MISRKTIIALTAIVLTGTAPAFAGGLAYPEAAAPWSAEQAVKMPPAITPDFLKGVAGEFGATAAAGLAEKKEKVAEIVKHLKACALNAEDLKTAGRYLTPGFRTEVGYAAEQGCRPARETAVGKAQAEPRSMTLSTIQELSASGAIFTYGGSARFFDGASGKGQSAVQVTASAPAAAGKAVAVRAAPAKPLASKVPVLNAASALPAAVTAQRPASFGSDRMVHEALAYWGAMRRENWAAFKTAGTRADKVKFFLKASAGAGFGGLLMYSNLEAVETDSARLGWDARHASGAGALAADAGKLVFNSFVFIMAFAPLPFLEVAKAALAGEGWALALVAAMGAGTVNHYILPVAD
ncbi:MAG: hypothetical protein NTY45_12990 [Elusimicrobia bacterium]|nr:hypothetical protein [Elusimicrobiota bacterium]